MQPKPAAVGLQFSAEICYNGSMTLRRFIGVAATATIALPQAVLAYNLGDKVVVATGVVTTLDRIITGIVNVLLFWGGGVTTTIFLIGAFMMVGSGGGQFLDRGKKLMFAALIGYAIILSAWLIMSTVVFFIAG